MLLRPRLFISTALYHQLGKGQNTKKNGEQSTDLNTNGIVISYNRSIIDDGNLHTWFMLHILQLASLSLLP